MLGIGEQLMLMNGYAKYELWVCCWKASAVCVAPWSLFCPMVGNALPKMLPAMPVVGKAMFADSISWAVAVCVCRPVSVLFWTMTGKPQDIGIRLALAGTMTTAAANRTSVSSANIFFI